MKEQKYTSAGSSPSREVQEIMSLTDSDYYKEQPPEEATVQVKTEISTESCQNGDVGFSKSDYAAAEKIDKILGHSSKYCSIRIWRF